MDSSHVASNDSRTGDLVTPAKLGTQDTRQKTMDERKFMGLENSIQTEMTPLKLKRSSADGRDDTQNLTGEASALMPAVLPINDPSPTEDFTLEQQNPEQTEVAQESSMHKDDKGLEDKLVSVAPSKDYQENSTHEDNSAALSGKFDMKRQDPMQITCYRLQ